MKSRNLKSIMGEHQNRYTQAKDFEPLCGLADRIADCMVMSATWHESRKMVRILCRSQSGDMALVDIRGVSTIDIYPVVEASEEFRYEIERNSSGRSEEKIVPIPIFAKPSVTASAREE